MAESLKDQLKKKILVKEEIESLLGKGRGNVRSCFAHADKTPSLSFNPAHGGWACHSCGRKGDLFSLYMQVKNWDFSTTLQYLFTKYGLWEKPDKLKRRAPESEKHTSVSDQTRIAEVEQGFQKWLTYPDKIEFMRIRYGLELETIKKYGLFLAKGGRVAIPIWKNKVGWTADHEGLYPIMNIRYHDAFRASCSWEKDGVVRASRPQHITPGLLAKQELDGWSPKWSAKAPKSLSVTGHGSPYLYPMHVALEHQSLYLVGGEFKALLLNQLGIPAVTFAGGEGAWDDSVVPLFVGKKFRVLMDVDDAGVRATERLASLLLDNGCEVEKGGWPASIREELPDKGDITDYLIKCDLEPDALEFIEWEKLVVDVADPDLHLIPPVIPPWKNMEPIEFGNLVDPANIDKWVRFQGMVSGRGETPYVVPSHVIMVCKAGREEKKPQCDNCRLPRTKFAFEKQFPPSQQLEWVGLPVQEIRGRVAKELGVPPKCPFPEVQTLQSSVDVVILTPSVDGVKEGAVDGKGSQDQDLEFEYASRQSYLISDQRIDIRENTTYEFGGHLVPDPKNSRFTTAVRSFRAAEGDIFHHTPNLEMDKRLDQILVDGVDSLITELRDHVCHIYGQDEMLKAILLSMMLPFTFSLGGQRSERVCPSMLILGDTTVGKSTTTKSFMRHYGAGRFKTMDSRPTFAGLIGGNIPYGNRFAFSWGLLPTSHRGWVGLDEFAKLPVEQVGEFTNTLSSGVAERTTVSGLRSTLCHVRLLYLTNPRGERPLSVLDPYDAAVGVMHTVQDLGRLDYVHIQQKLGDDNHHFFTEQQQAHSSPRYDRALARYHLGWVWSLTPERILFEDVDDILKRSGELSSKYGGNVLLLPAMARFKIARLAAGYASLLYSREGDKLMVKKEHVDLALRMVDGNYGKFLKVYKNMDSLPEEIVSFLNTLDKYQHFKTLVMAEYFTREDLTDHMGVMSSGMFIQLFQIQHGFITRNRQNYKFVDEQVKTRLLNYVADRVKQDRRRLMQT